MKLLKAITKVIATDSELRATCITSKGNAMSLIIDLKDRPELKKLVDELSAKVLNHLEKEIG